MKTRNLTENRVYNNKERILKKNKSQYPNSVNLLDIRINNNLYNGKNTYSKYQLERDSLNNNNKNIINNFKTINRYDIQENAKIEKELMNKKIFVKKMTYFIYILIIILKI